LQSAQQEPAQPLATEIGDEPDALEFRGVSGVGTQPNTPAPQDSGGAEFGDEHEVAARRCDVRTGDRVEQLRTEAAFESFGEFVVVATERLGRTLARGLTLEDPDRPRQLGRRRRHRNMVPWPATARQKGAGRPGQLRSDIMDGSEPDHAPRICVVAPTPLLVMEIAAGAAGQAGTATSIEPADEGPEVPEQHADIHMHPGGQGLWVARMAVSLGAAVTVCGPFGGELGSSIVQMLNAAELTVRSVTAGAGNGAYVFDLRGQDREIVAHMPPPPLTRHELDDLYGTVLVDALDSDVLVLTGAEPASVVPPSFFGRITADVRAAGKPVVADLSGEAATAAAEAGPTVLKMSHEEVVEAGLAEDSTEALRQAAEGLVAGGVTAMVVSRAADPALLVTADGARYAVGPVVSPLDHRGAGDSMTAGIAVGLGRGLEVTDAVRLGAAAGALNVTRRGLGTGRRDQIERFAERVSITDADTADNGDGEEAEGAD